MRSFYISLYLFLLALSLVSTVAAQECPGILLTGKTRPTSNRGVLAGQGKARIIVKLRSKDPIDNIAFKLALPNGLSAVRTTTRPLSKGIGTQQIMQNADGSTNIFWLGMNFTKSKGGKRIFKIKVAVNTCASETLVVTGLAYMANATSTFCQTPLANPQILRVRYGKGKKSATCAPTLAPTVNPTQPFVLFSQAQRFSQAGQLAPFTRYLHSTRPDNSSEPRPAGKHRLQTIGTPTPSVYSCYEYCSGSLNLSAPFLFEWNRVTNDCFCCTSECGPLIYDPDFNVYEAQLDVGNGVCNGCPGCKTPSDKPCECTCPLVCNKCGPKQRRCGGGALKDEGSCTPYYFLPNVDNKDNRFIDTPPFAMDKVLGSAKCDPPNWNCFQAWQTPGFQDQWVTHGGDGAGIQPLDCGGDIGYFERFEGKGRKDRGFNMNLYGPTYGMCDLTTTKSIDCQGHIPSYFDHPSKPPVPFNNYTCGWWRAYNNPLDASIVRFGQGYCTETALLSAPRFPIGTPLFSVPENCYGKGTSVRNGGLLNAQGKGGDWFKESVYAFRNTENMATYQTLGALWHTFAYTNDGKPCGMPPDYLQCPDYKAWFTGTLFPWVCAYQKTDDLCPWNLEQSDVNKCYCDNEPWRGRHQFPEPNWNTKLVYCVLDYSDNLRCDSISLRNDNDKVGFNPDSCKQNACGGYSIKDTSDFKLQAAAWPPQ